MFFNIFSPVGRILRIAAPTSLRLFYGCSTVVYRFITVKQP